MQLRNAARWSLQRAAPKQHTSSGFVPRKKACVCPAAAASPTAYTWDEIRGQTRDTLGDYTLRKRQVPSSSPTSVLPTQPDSHLQSKKPVVLFRDTNAWCPYCQRVWLALEEKGIDYDTVFIDLRNKPEWFKDVVPTTKVPAVSILGKVTWESKDILLLLEDCFPDAPLLPADESAREEALVLMDKVDSAPWVSAGFALLTAGAPNMFMPEGRDEERLPELQSRLEEQLQELEALLGCHPEGPFLLGQQLSVPDIMMVPAMERLAVALASFRSYSIDSNTKFPLLAAWYEALRMRPAHRRTCSDSGTHQLVFGKRASLQMIYSLQGLDDWVLAGRREAAGKLATNKKALIKDILKGSGLTRYRGSPYGRTVVSPNGYDGEVNPLIYDAVDWTLLRAANFLLTGQVGPRPATPEQAEVGAATLAYLRSRISAPRDMSAAAAEQLRAACDVMLANTY